MPLFGENRMRFMFVCDSYNKGIFFELWDFSIVGRYCNVVRISLRIIVLVLTLFISYLYSFKSSHMCLPNFCKYCLFVLYKLPKHKTDPFVLFSSLFVSVMMYKAIHLEPDRIASKHFLSKRISNVKQNKPIM